MKRLQILAASTAILLVMNACSTDKTQEVVENTKSSITGKSQDVIDDDSIPGEDDPFPKLGATPERPETPDVVKQQEALQSGLVADNEHAKYEDQELRSADAPSIQTPVSEPPVASSVPSLQADGQAKDRSNIIPMPMPTPIPVPEEMSQQVSQMEVYQPETISGYVSNSDNVQVNEDAVAALSANRAEEVASNGVHIATLYYPRGISDLTARDKNVLAQVAQIYRESAGKGVVMIGHASIPVSPTATNPDLVNYKVSLDRAAKVADMLNRLGVPQEAILMDARGDKDPARMGDSPEDHAYNRRTEIYFKN